MTIIRRITYIFILLILMTGNTFFLSAPEISYAGMDRVMDDSESDLESAYIELTKYVESKGKTISISYDAFIDGYKSSEFVNISDYIDVVRGNELAIFESDLQELTIENSFISDQNALIDNETTDVLKSLYEEITGKYNGLDLDFETLLVDYLRTENKDPVEYSEMVKQVLEEEKIQTIDSIHSDAWYYNTGTSLPQRADYSHYKLLETVKKGDIVFEKAGGFGITGHAAIVEGIFYSTHYRQFYVRIIEAIKPKNFDGVARSVLDDSRVDEKEAFILRPNSSDATNIVINNAVRFCISQLGKGYNFDRGHDTSGDENDWYCSELVWAAYYNQGVDLEQMVSGYVDRLLGVLPYDLYHSSEVIFINYITCHPYIDVDSHWARDYIQYNINNGLMSGVADSIFAPDVYVTRAMFVTMLYRLAGTPTDIGSNDFSDVSESSYYYSAVSWASNKGIVSGTTPTTFSPDSYITRQDLVVLLFRFCSKYLGAAIYLDKPYQIDPDDVDMGIINNLSHYSDYYEISVYARRAMRWAVWNEILSGTTNTTLSPKMNCSRAQAATFMYKFITCYLDNI